MKTLKTIIVLFLSVFLLSSFTSKGFDEIKEARDYYNGINGVKRNKSLAFELFEKLAKSGNPFAKYYLGRCYENGDGVSEDHKNAEKLYQDAIKGFLKLSDKGDTYAQFYLGLCCYNGRGVEKSYTDAFKWYKESAEKGNAFSQNNLAYMYENGDGVTQSITESLKWFEKSDQNGNVDATLRLGHYYYNKGDFANAIKFYINLNSATL